MGEGIALVGITHRCAGCIREKDTEKQKLKKQ